MKIRTELLSRGRIAVFLFALSLLAMFVINGVNVRNSVPYIQEVSDKATRLPDTLLYYDSDQLYDILDSLGASGREAYGSFLLTFDAGFPLLYSGALSLSAWVLLRKASSESSNLAKLCLIPIVAGLFDYMENTSMLVLLHRYTERLNELASAAGCFTLAKWVMTSVSAALLIVAIGGLWTKSNTRSPQQPS